jgi:hypothetical protein
MFRIFRLVGWLALVAPMAAHASAIVQAFAGDVRVGGSPVVQDQRVFRGTSVTTGGGSQVILRFDDGQQVILNQNTEFRIADFQFSAGSPREDRSVFDLVKGALRIVSGVIGRRNQEAFQLRTPQMTIGIRGTDFMVAVINPGYVTVQQGSVSLTNAAGTAVFGQGATAMAASSATMPTAVSAAQIPAAAAQAFTSLGSTNLAAAGPGALGGASSGAASAAGAAAVSKPVMTMIVFGAIAVGVAAIVSKDDDDEKTPTTHHH